MRKICHLAHRYEINKIVREDKVTKRSETIYLSSEAECRERSGIEKMLRAEGIDSDEKLIKEIIKVNLKFGKYHLLSELNEQSVMLAKCEDKREEALVKSLSKLLEAAYARKMNDNITDES